MMTIKEMQTEMDGWARRNFGGGRARWPLLGIFEELGELSHAQLKQEQKIRGTYAELEGKKKDAVGDATIFLFDYCSTMGWSVQDDLLVEGEITLGQLQEHTEDSSPVWDFLHKLMRLVADETMSGDNVLSQEDVVQLFLNLAIYCRQRGWSLQTIVEETWAHVSTRDWTKNKHNGGDAGDESQKFPVGMAVANLDAVRKLELFSEKLDLRAVQSGRTPWTAGAQALFDGLTEDFEKDRELFKKIDAWHTDPADTRPLPEVLGMTAAEYAAWVSPRAGTVPEAPAADDAVADEMTLGALLAQHHPRLREVPSMRELLVWLRGAPVGESGIARLIALAFDALVPLTFWNGGYATIAQRRFTCPQCGGHTFESSVEPDGSYLRHCLDHSCPFRWHQREDDRYMKKTGQFFPRTQIVKAPESTGEQMEAARADQDQARGPTMGVMVPHTVCPLCPSGASGVSCGHVETKA